MKITIVQGAFLPVPPLRGGAVERVWYGLGKAFAAKGHEVVHISRQCEDLPRRSLDEGVSHIRIKGFDAPPQLWKLKYRDMLYSARAKRAIPSSDIVVTNTFWLPIFLRNEKLGKTCVHVQRYPRGQMRFYRHCSRIQAVSTMIASAVISQCPDLARITNVLPNHLDVQWFREALPGPTRQGILFVGRIHPEKGLHLLIEAFSLLTDADRQHGLTIVGPHASQDGGGGDAYLTHLQSQASNLDVDVNWVGPIYDEDALLNIYDRAAVFAYPSTADRGEAMPVAPLEAMARGCISVLSNMACYEDYAKDKENCLLFDYRTNPAHNLSTALAQSLNLGTKDIPTNAQVTAREYNVDAVSDLYLNDFQSLIGMDK